MITESTTNGCFENCSSDDANTNNKEEERCNRSVNDFNSQVEIEQALLSDVPGCCNASEPPWLFSKSQEELERLLKHEDGNTVTSVKEIDQQLDWVLENYDNSNSIEQSLTSELKRLLVLKSYLVLDTEFKEECFDEIASLARGRFDCPIALITLVDLGRQWFLSKQGLPQEVTETPRKAAFCAHALQSKDDVFVVCDALEDTRFVDNPLVTGPPDIRFYAGAPLISPEGYKLGTVCVVDTKPRNHLSIREKEDLKEFSRMAVQGLVAHRQNKSSYFRKLVSTSYPTFDKKSDEISSDDDDNDEGDINGDDQFQVDDDLELDFIQEETAKRTLLCNLLSDTSDTDTTTQQVKDRQQQHCGAVDGSNTFSPTTKDGEQPISIVPFKTKLSKRFRFADEENEAQLAKIFGVESWKHCKEIWWNHKELKAVRRANYRTVQYYQKNRKDYARCIQMLYQPFEYTREELENSITKLVKYSSARGLESHIVTILSLNRELIVDSVLDHQEECRRNAADANTMSRYLSEVSLFHSRPWKHFAEMMARCDQLYASSSSSSFSSSAAATTTTTTANSTCLAPTLRRSSSSLSYFNTTTCRWSSTPISETDNNISSGSKNYSCSPKPPSRWSDAISPAKKKVSNAKAPVRRISSNSPMPIRSNCSAAGAHGNNGCHMNLYRQLQNAAHSTLVD